MEANELSARIYGENAKFQKKKNLNAYYAHQLHLIMNNESKRELAYTHECTHENCFIVMARC